MATIGRKAAVANIKWPFKAPLERLSRLDDLAGRSHLLSHWLPQPASPSFTNGRGPTLIFSDGARLITGSQDLPGWNEHTEPRGSVYSKNHSTSAHQELNAENSKIKSAPTIKGQTLFRSTSNSDYFAEDSISFHSSPSLSSTPAAATFSSRCSHRRRPRNRQASTGDRCSSHARKAD